MLLKFVVIYLPLPTEARVEEKQNAKHFSRKLLRQKAGWES
jgi:hypothetical protein